MIINMRNESITMACMFLVSVVLGTIHYLDSGKINIVPLALFTVSVLYFCLVIIEGQPMFNWFRKREYPNVDAVAQLPDPTTYPPMPKVRVPSENGYTIGMDDQDNTILRLTCDYSTTTLTMTQSGVRQMIRLLEATLPHATKK